MLVIDPSPVPALRSRALARRHQQGAQAGETVGVDQAERDQFGQCVLKLGAQQAGAVDEFVEERGAVFTQPVGDQLRARGQWGRFGLLRGQAAANTGGDVVLAKGLQL